MLIITMLFKFELMQFKIVIVWMCAWVMNDEWPYVCLCVYVCVCVCADVMGLKIWMDVIKIDVCYIRLKLLLLDAGGYWMANIRWGERFAMKVDPLLCIFHSILNVINIYMYKLKIIIIISRHSSMSVNKYGSRKTCYFSQILRVPILNFCVAGRCRRLPHKQQYDAKELRHAVTGFKL